MIGDGKLLTNAHCVEHYTQVTFKVFIEFLPFIIYYLTALVASPYCWL